MWPRRGPLASLRPRSGGSPQRNTDHGGVCVPQDRVYSLTPNDYIFQARPCPTLYPYHPALAPMRRPQSREDLAAACAACGKLKRAPASGRVQPALTSGSLRPRGLQLWAVGIGVEGVAVTVLHPPC
jgi:hypothetical protein